MRSDVAVKMGFMDAFKNESYDKPAVGGGLTNAPKKVKATYNGKSVDAIINGKLTNVTRSLGMGLSYSCSSGDCGTCEILVNGKKTRPCVAKVPTKDFTVKKKR